MIEVRRFFYSGFGAGKTENQIGERFALYQVAVHMLRIGAKLKRIAGGKRVLAVRNGDLDRPLRCDQIGTRPLRRHLSDGGRLPVLQSPSSSFRELAWVMLLSGGTLWVSQTLPPMLEPRPIVTRPRIVAPA